MKLETKSTYILILVTAIWGMTFPLIENAVEFISPTSFVVIRMLLASLGFLPFIYSYLRHSTKLIFFGGLLLATLNSLTYLFQTAGLQTIPASRSAFITGFSVVLVPLFAPLFRLGFPKTIDIISAVICLLGLYILTGENVHHLSVGDLWSLACALTYALSVLSLQVIAKHTAENMLLSFYTTALGVWIPLTFLHHITIAEINHWQVILAVIFCGLLATSFVTYLTTRYQKHIRVTRVALIYALEPVFATIFAFLFFGQPIGIATLIGGLLIFSSIVLPGIKFKV